MEILGEFTHTLIRRVGGVGGGTDYALYDDDAIIDIHGPTQLKNQLDTYLRIHQPNSFLVHRRNVYVLLKQRDTHKMQAYLNTISAPYSNMRCVSSNSEILDPLMEIGRSSAVAVNGRIKKPNSGRAKIRRTFIRNVQIPDKHRLIFLRSTIGSMFFYGLRGFDFPTTNIAITPSLFSEMFQGSCKWNKPI